MPAIRLAEIPNALPRSAGASGANIQPPSQPGFVVRPQVAQLDGAAMLSAESPGRAARNMLAQTLEQDAFTAEARAAGRFGASLNQVGAAALQWGEKFAKAKDTADLAKAETVMRGVFEKQQNEQLDLPPDQWGENWTRNMDIAKKEMSKIKFSNNAMEQFAPSWERWTSLSQVQIGGQQRKAQIGEMRTSIEAAATQRLAAKDFAGAFSLIDKAVQDGTYTPAEGEMFKARAADNEFQQARADNLNRLAGDIQSDPWAIKPQLERRAKGEEVPELGDITVMQANTLLNNAEGTIRGKIADQDDEADQAVLTGAIKDPKQLRERFPKLSERRLLEHEKTMRAVYDASPEGWARVTAARPKLLSAIETYDPAKDDWQMSAYYTLKDQIKSAMPPGEQAEMLELIVKKRREGNKLPAPVQDAVKTLDKLAESGWFGKADPKKLESKDPATRAAEAKTLIESGATHKRFQDDFLDWAKKNPDMARDREKVQKQIQIMVDPKASQAAMDFFNSAVQKREAQRRIETDAANTLDFGQYNWGSGGTVPMFNATDKAGSAEPRQPASIRNNNAGAMWPAEWQKKFGGSHGENLADGKGNKIAKFPTPVQGAAATMYLLGNEKLRYSGKTVRDGIKLWSNAGGGDLEAYVGVMADAGFGADEKIGEIMADPEKAVAFTKAMSRFEAGQDFPLDDEGWAAAFDLYRRNI